MLPNLRLARPHLHDLLSSLPHYGAHYEGFTRRRSALVAAPRRYHSGRVVEDVKFASLQTSMANMQPPWQACKRPWQTAADLDVFLRGPFASAKSSRTFLLIELVS